MFLGALTLFVGSALATQTFGNTGKISGWDAVFIDSGSKGNVQQVTNVVYKGPTALKMTQIYDQNYSGRYHAEVLHHNAMKRGDTGFYGFAFRLQPDWQASPAQSYNIVQFGADFTDLGCAEDFMPGTMVEILGDKLVTRRKYGSVCPRSAQRTEYFDNLATVTPGVWHKVVIQANWQSDDTGFLRLWYDDTKVLEKLNIATSVNDGREFEFRVGLYANGWHDDGELKGNQRTRQVWYDEVGLGSVYADADPEQA